MTVQIRVPRRTVPYRDLTAEAKAWGFFETPEGAGHSTSGRNKRMGVICLIAGATVWYLRARFQPSGGMQYYILPAEVGALLLGMLGLVLLVTWRCLLFDKNNRVLTIQHWRWPFCNARTLSYSQLRGWGTTNTTIFLGGLLWRVKGVDCVFLVFRNDDRWLMYYSRALNSKAFHDICTWLRYHTDLSLLRL